MKHIAKKRFGQNFLTDQSVISSLVEAISPQPDDLMVEIGPGLGALTKPLLQKLKLLLSLIHILVRLKSSCCKVKFNQIFSSRCLVSTTLFLMLYNAV